MSVDANMYDPLWKNGVDCTREFWEMKLQYRVKQGVVTIHSFGGDAMNSWAFWNDVRIAMNDFIQKWFIFDVTEIQDSHWGKFFMEKISTVWGKIIFKNRCFQTWLIEDIPYHPLSQVSHNIHTILTQV